MLVTPEAGKNGKAKLIFWILISLTQIKNQTKYQRVNIRNIKTGKNFSTFLRMESLETNLVYPPSRENYAPVIWNPGTTLPPPPTRLTGALHATRDPIQSLKLPVFKTNKTLSNIRNLFIALPSGSVCYSSHKRSLSRRWLMGDTGRSLLINEVEVEVEDRVEAGHTFWKSF